MLGVDVDREARAKEKPSDHAPISIGLADWSRGIFVAMVVSAGLLVHRRGSDGPEVMLAHPGGPLWKNRDRGWWTIPKGIIEGDEPPLAAAIREFREETGLEVSGAFRVLTPLRQKGGKRILCWAIEADLDLSRFSPGEFELEWPPKSGRTARFPEVDRVEYFPLTEALSHILPSQAPLIVEALRPT